MFENTLSESQRQKIIDALRRTAEAPCPRCGKAEFTIAEGYTPVMVSRPGAVPLRADQQIPCVAVICLTCGAVLLHAVGILLGADAVKDMATAPPFAPAAAG